jgi:hypothetical protein
VIWETGTGATGLGHRGQAQWSSGRILALGARDPRFEPGLGPSFLFRTVLRLKRGNLNSKCKGHLYSIGARDEDQER